MRIVTKQSEFEKKVKTSLAKWSDLEIEIIEGEETSGFGFHLEEQALPQAQLFFDRHVRPTISSAQLLGKGPNDRWTVVNRRELYFVEAIGREVFAYTKEQGFHLKERLYELEQLPGFMRINKSTVVNVAQVLALKSLLNGKLLLTLKDEQELEVSRNYVKAFKAYLKEGVAE